MVHVLHPLVCSLFLEQILKTLTRNLPCPVSCKIRLLADPHKTVDLARALESTGISALAVHMR